MPTRKEAAYVHRFFESVTREWTYSQLVRKSLQLSRLLSRLIKTPLGPTDIIIDKAPVKSGAEEYKLGGFRIHNRRRDLWEDLPQKVAALDKYLDDTQQGYIFCSPLHYQALKGLTLDDWSEVLGDAYD